MDIDNHWLKQARKRVSENYNERPSNTDISLIVIHCISLPRGSYGTPYIEELFCNRLDYSAHKEFAQLRGLRVSSHVVIDRLGEITQFVGFDKRAWHAGVSSYKNRENCNDYSIGIELEGVDDASFTDAQYQQLSQLCDLLFQQYPLLNKETLAGHSEIALPLGRKTDPGTEFDWQRLRLLLSDQNKA